MEIRDWVYPKPIVPGMKIAFIAPASASGENLEELRKKWEVAGFSVEFGATCYATGEYGGTADEQAAEFNYYMTNKSDCDAVIALRGGYGSIRYLEKLEYEEIRYAHKAFVGYSDCTALHLALQTHSQLISYHAPMGYDHLHNEDADFEHLVKLLAGQVKIIEPLPAPPRGEIGTDLGTGRLIGGNLAIICSLGGTAYVPDLDFWKECILFIEEVGEKPYRIDRMLQQLRQQGVLGKVKGMAIGNFLNCEDDESDEFYDVGAMALAYMTQSRLDKNGEIPEGEEPYVFYLPTGHGMPHKGIPLGSMVSFRYISNTMLCLPYTK